MCWQVHRMSKFSVKNIANVWFQKSRVSSRSRNVQVSVSSRVFAQSLGLVSVSQRQCLVSVSVTKILAETPALAVAYYLPQKKLLSPLSSVKLMLMRKKCYQCKLFCSGTMNEWCQKLTIKILTEVYRT